LCHHGIERESYTGFKNVPENMLFCTIFINDSALFGRMGRIKTQYIKRASVEFMKRHKDALSTDFTENTTRITKYAIIRSKKLRNAIAGYVTRLKKAEH
jgi:small subunit ribosomal protein S17e